MLVRRYGWALYSEQLPVDYDNHLNFYAHIASTNRSLRLLLRSVLLNFAVPVGCVRFSRLLSLAHACLESKSFPLSGLRCPVPTMQSQTPLVARMTFILVTFIASRAVWVAQVKIKWGSCHRIHVLCSCSSRPHRAYGPGMARPTSQIR